MFKYLLILLILGYVFRRILFTPSTRAARNKGVQKKIKGIRIYGQGWRIYGL